MEILGLGPTSKLRSLQWGKNAIRKSNLILNEYFIRMTVKAWKKKTRKEEKEKEETEEKKKHKKIERKKERKEGGRREGKHSDEPFKLSKFIS